MPDLLQWTKEQVVEFCVRGGGTANEGRILANLMQLLEGEKYEDVGKAFCLYLYIEGFNKGAQHEKSLREEP